MDETMDELNPARKNVAVNMSDSLSASYEDSSAL